MGLEPTTYGNAEHSLAEFMRRSRIATGRVEQSKRIMWIPLDIAEGIAHWASGEYELAAQHWAIAAVMVEQVRLYAPRALLLAVMVARTRGTENEKQPKSWDVG